MLDKDFKHLYISIAKFRWGITSMWGLKDFKANLTHMFTEWKLSLYTLFSNLYSMTINTNAFSPKNQQI